MMGMLLQTPPSAGVPPALAALGSLAPADGEESDFARLVTAAPAQTATPASIEGGLSIDAIIAKPVTKTPTAPVTGKADAVPSTDAAAAANLLLAVASRPAGSAPQGEAQTPKPAADASAEGATNMNMEGNAQSASPADGGQAGASVAASSPALAAISMPVPTSVPAPASTISSTIPKPAKPADPTIAAREGDTATLPVAAKPRDAGEPAMSAANPFAAKAKTTEAGPSMTILLSQPAAHGTVAIAEAARSVPVAERTLDLASDDTWIEQLAADITATKSQTGDISFRLMPRHLGRLDVALRQGDEGVSLKMDTQHEATATIVTAAQGRLVEDLRQQGVRVAGAEVTCTPGETSRQSQQGQGQGRAAAHDPAHLIETATERAEPRDKERAAERGGRFA